ncbi:Ku domain protein (plasmid) [Cupriavidus necator H850]|nr:Ku domain protein [Cupriavidus necator H850]
MAARSLASLSLSFGLVSIPVKLYTQPRPALRCASICRARKARG